MPDGKRLFSVIMAVLLLTVRMPARAQEPSIPYIQYFSLSLNAFIIERADGTDTRVLAYDLMTADDGTNGVYVDGPGWSPSGQWFAWTSTRHVGDGGGAYDSDHRPHVLSVDGTQRLNMLADVEDAWLAWANDRDVLFVATHQDNRILRDNLAAVLATEFNYDPETVERFIEVDRAKEQQRESPMESVYIVDTTLSAIDVSNGIILGTFTHRRFSDDEGGLPAIVQTSDRNHIVMSYREACAYFDRDCGPIHRVTINAVGEVIDEPLTIDAQFRSTSTAGWVVSSIEDGLHLEHILTHETHQWSPMRQLRTIFWSPGGEQALLLTEDELWALDCSAATLMLLRGDNVFTAEYYNYEKPVWSTNGSYALLLGTNKDFYVFDRAQGTLRVWPLSNEDYPWESVRWHWLDDTHVALVRNTQSMFSRELHVYDLASSSLDPTDAGFPDSVRLRLSAADQRLIAYVYDGVVIHDRFTHSEQPIRPAYASYRSFGYGDVIWDDTGEWLLIAESAVVAGSGTAEHLGIVRVDGRFRRDLSFSRRRTPLTMIWLPPQVDPADLPPASRVSPVPQPAATVHGSHWSFYADWSPDGRWLAAGLDQFDGGDITVWEVATGEIVHTFNNAAENERVLWPPGDSFTPELHTPAPDRVAGYEHALARSPDGRQVFDGRDVIDIDTGQVVAALEAGGGFYALAAYRPDGSLLATASFDSPVIIWDTATWRPVATLPNRGQAVAFSPDGARLAVAVSWDVQFWDVAALLETEAARTRRHLGS